MWSRSNPHVEELSMSISEMRKALRDDVHRDLDVHRFFLIRIINALGIGKPRSLYNVPREALDLAKSSHHAQALSYIDLTAAIGKELKGLVLEHVKILREHLPELASYNDVQFDFTKHSWTVDIKSSRFPSPMPLPAFIAGCPVYLHGDNLYHAWFQPGVITHFWYPPALQCRYEIDLAQHIPEETVWLIAKHFPRSFGFRVLHNCGTHTRIIKILYSCFENMNSDDKCFRELPPQLSDHYYDLTVVALGVGDHPIHDRTVVDTAKADKALDDVDERIVLLEEHIKNKEALVLGNDYLYCRTSKTFRKAILYRSDIDALGGKLAWQDYISTTLRRGLLGEKPTLFKYKGTFVS